MSVVWEDPTDRGVCLRCGCTEDNACIDIDGEPCKWFDRNRNLCSKCAKRGIPEIEHYAVARRNCDAAIRRMFSVKPEISQVLTDISDLRSKAGRADDGTLAMFSSWLGRTFAIVEHERRRRRG
jgi:hypothetical protein